MLDYKLIGSRIQERRIKQGLTQEAVAEKAGITTVYMSKIENGHVKPTLDRLDSICRIIGCDFGALFSQTSPESSDYQCERVVQLFQTCAPEIKPVAINLLKQLSEIKIRPQ